MRRRPSRLQTSGASYVDPAGGVTLNDAIALALEHEPGLRASRAQIDMTRGLREQAALRPNPSLSFVQQQEPGGTDNQTRVELQWPLDLFRKTGRVEVADREIDVAQQTVSERERTLASDVRLAYGQIAAAVRTLTVTEQLLAAIQSTTDVDCRTCRTGRDAAARSRHGARRGPAARSGALASGWHGRTPPHGPEATAGNARGRVASVAQRTRGPRPTGAGTARAHAARGR